MAGKQKIWVAEIHGLLKKLILFTPLLKAQKMPATDLAQAILRIRGMFPEESN